MASNVIEEYKTQKNMDICGVSWFKLNELSGTTLNDSKGITVGTLYGSPVWNSKGLIFDGINDYIQFNSKLPIGVKTLKIKMKTPSVKPSSQYNILSDYTDTANQKVGMRILINSNGNLMWQSFSSFINNTTSTYRFNVEALINVCDGIEHEFMFCWDGTTNTNTVNIYIDKILVASGTANSVETVSTAASYNFVFGRINLSPYERYMKGELYTLEIYNQALTPLDFVVEKTLIRKVDQAYIYYDTVASEWSSIGTSPTDEDWINKGVDTITQAQLEKLSQQAIVGKFAVKML